MVLLPKIFFQQLSTKNIFLMMTRCQNNRVIGFVAFDEFIINYTKPYIQTLQKKKQFFNVLMILRVF